MNPIRVTEYEWIPISSLGGLEGHLAKIESGLPKGTITWGFNAISFGRYCGVIQVDGLTIEVLPKTSSARTADEERIIFLRMLELALDIRLYSTGDAMLGWSDFTLLDLFILRFCDELQRCLVAGMHRQYIRHEDNLTMIRGKVMVAANVRANIHRADHVFCAFDELSDNTLLNRVIRTTLGYLYALAKSDRARRNTNELLSRFDQVDAWVCNLHQLDAIQLDRNASRFEGILEQCRWFLRGLSPDVFSGEHTNIALLFSMPKLFEEVVAREIRTHLAPQGYQVRAQGPIRAFVGPQDDPARTPFSMKPDITVFNDGIVKCVMDTKWKVLEAGSDLGISQSDLYQIATYGSEYDAAFGNDQDTPPVALVYPVARNTDVGTLHRWQIRGQKRPLFIVTVPIGLLASGVGRFRTELRKIVDQVLG